MNNYERRKSVADQPDLALVVYNRGKALFMQWKPAVFTKVGGTFFAVAGVVATLGWAQQGTPQQSSQQISVRQAGVEQAPTQPPVEAAPGSSIRVAVEEVIVPVTVTDEKGRFVSNLEQKDFEIFENGKTQTIRYFSRERSQPVVVGFLLDLSNSSRSQWKNFQSAAVELVLTLLPGKEKFSGYLIGYGNEAELMVNTTTDPEPIINRIRELKPGGGAALYDAIYLACTSRTLVKGEPVEPRRVLIVIGDGNDNASQHTLNEVIEIAQRNLVTIYGISTKAYGFESPGDSNLVRMTEETGGRVEYPLQEVYKDVSGFLSKPSDEGNFAFKVGTGGFASAISSSIFRAIANVAGEVTTQYVLRYIPNVEPTPEKPYREINVKVALPAVTVRARKGYYPNSQ